MNICDLHCHSTCSDGSCTPEEVVELACAAGLSAVALTDHNTVEGVERAARAAEGRIAFCGGCEFTTQAEGRELHLLGLFLDPVRAAPLQSALEEQLRRKEQSNQRTLEALAAAGYPLEYEEFVAHYGGGVKNRVHIARYLMEKGIVADIDEAFRDLLSPSGGYYRGVEKLDFFEMIPRIAEAGGVSVWAHPLQRMDPATFERLLPKAVACGLDGLEVYYPAFSAEETELLRSRCRDYGLIESGGTDFHGEHKPGLRIGTGYGAFRVPMSCFAQLKARAEERR